MFKFSPKEDTAMICATAAELTTTLVELAEDEKFSVYPWDDSGSHPTFSLRR
jgi:hypothetical protein